MGTCAWLLRWRERTRCCISTQRSGTSAVPESLFTETRRNALLYLNLAVVIITRVTWNSSRKMFTAEAHSELVEIWGKI